MSEKPPAEASEPRSQLVRALRGGEELVANLALAAMVILPLAEILVRPILSGGIPGSISFVQHLTLWVGFLGAALAAREGKLIALATATFIPEGKVRQATEIFSAFVGSAVCLAVQSRAASHEAAEEARVLRLELQQERTARREDAESRALQEERRRREESERTLLRERWEEERSRVREESRAPPMGTTPVPPLGG